MKYLANYLSGKKEVKTAEEARNQAIAWQQWASEQSLSYGELSEWQDYFWTLGTRFNLITEFQNEGII